VLNGNMLMLPFGITFFNHATSCKDACSPI
jgi:hypothetical protein